MNDLLIEILIIVVGIGGAFYLGIFIGKKELSDQIITEKEKQKRYSNYQCGYDAGYTDGYESAKKYYLGIIKEALEKEGFEVEE